MQRKKEVDSQSGREARRQAGWRGVSQMDRHAEWEAGGQLVKAGRKASMKKGRRARREGGTQGVTDQEVR